MVCLLLVFYPGAKGSLKEETNELAVRARGTTKEVWRLKRPLNREAHLRGESESRH